MVVNEIHGNVLMHMFSVTYNTHTYELRLRATVCSLIIHELS